MFTSYILLFLASVLPMDTRQDIDDAKHEIYRHLNESQLDSAHILVDLAIQKSEAVNYNFGKAKSIFIKSYLFRVDNKLGKSFILNLEALRLLRNDMDNRSPKTLADLYINTGEILSKHFRYDEAIQYYNEGIAIATRYGLKIREHELIYNKGVSTLKLGSYQSAFRLFTLAYKLGKETQDEWTIINSLNYLGLTAIKLQEYDIARNYFDQMINFEFESENSEEYKGYAYENIGSAYRLSGKKRHALEYYQHSLVHNLKFGDSLRIFEIQREIASLYYEMSEFDKAKAIALKSLTSYPFAIRSPENYQIFDLLTQICFQSNEYEAAERFHSKYIEENNKFLSSQQRVLQLSEQYKMEMLTANFFKDIEKQEQLAQLNQIIYLLLGLGLISFVFFRAKKYLLKRSLEQAFREVTQKKNLQL